MKLRSVITFLVAALVCGCGGGGTPTGRATVDVVWPSRSRVIPRESNSIKVELTRNGTLVASTVLVRPAGGGITSHSFESLPVSLLTANASAFPTKDGTGVAQANGTVLVNIQAGQTTQFTVNVQSTIDRIEAIPQNVTLDIGETQAFSVTARNARGEVVLIGPSTLQWSSSPSVASVNTTGMVTALAGGSTQIRVTETESGKEAIASVIVRPFPERYFVVDLGTLGGSFSIAQDVNALGEVVGLAHTAAPTEAHAFLWRGGTTIDLGRLDGIDSDAAGINDDGIVVGRRHTNNGIEKPFIWQNNVMADLPTGAGGSGFARKINNLGQVVGGTGGRAVIWHNGVTTDIAAGSGLDINSQGHVAGGFSHVSGATHAFWYKDGVLTDLGVLSGGDYSQAYGISEADHICGEARNWEGKTHAFLYYGQTLVDLGALNDGQSSAWSVNRFGQVVGRSTGPDSSRWYAFIYSSGQMIALDEKIDPGAGWALQEALSINDRGQIVGWGYHNGNARAFLLTPN